MYSHGACGAGAGRRVFDERKKSHPEGGFSCLLS